MVRAQPNLPCIGKITDGLIDHSLLAESDEEDEYQSSVDLLKAPKQTENLDLIASLENPVGEAEKSEDGSISGSSDYSVTLNEVSRSEEDVIKYIYRRKERREIHSQEAPSAQEEAESKRDDTGLAAEH